LTKSISEVPPTTSTIPESATITPTTYHPTTITNVSQSNGHNGPDGSRTGLNFNNILRTSLLFESVFVFSGAI